MMSWRIMEGGQRPKNVLWFMVCGAGGFAACRDRLYLLGPREGGDEE